MGVVKPVSLPEHCITCAEGVREKGAEMRCGAWIVKQSIDSLNQGFDGLTKLQETGEAVRVKLVGTAFALGISEADDHDLQDVISKGANECPGAAILTHRSTLANRSFITGESLAFPGSHNMYSDEEGHGYQAAIFGLAGELDTSLIRDDSPFCPQYGIGLNGAVQSIEEISEDELRGVLTEAAQPEYAQAADVLCTKVEKVRQSAASFGNTTDS